MADPRKLFEDSPDARSAFDAAPDAEPKLSRFDQLVAAVKRNGPELLQPWKAAADTASLGLLPRALAAGDAVGETLNGRGGLEHNYNHALTDRQSDSRKTAYNYPSASIAGAFLPTPAMGETLLQRTVGSGLVGAASGNLQAPHDDPSARLTGGLEGFLGGAAMQGINEKGGPLAGKLGSSLARDAELAAPRAAGLRAGISNQAKAHGMENEGDLREYGRKLLDSGLIKFGGTPHGVAERADAMATQNMGVKNDILGRSETTGKPFSYADAQKMMVRRMVGNKPGGLTASEEDAIGPASQSILNMGKQGSKTPGSVIGADRQKSSDYDSINWGADNAGMAKASALHRKAASGGRQSIEDHVAATLGQPAGQELRQANANTGLALDAKGMANDWVTREGAKLPWYVKAASMVGGGVAGHEVGGPKGAVVGMLAPAAASMLKGRGPSALAVGADVGSNAMTAIGKTQANPISSGRESDALSRWLTKKPDDEREKEGADNFSKAMGGR